MPPNSEWVFSFSFFNKESKDLLRHCLKEKKMVGAARLVLYCCWNESLKALQLHSVSL
jgi:hypothetical protein